LEVDFGHHAVSVRATLMPVHKFDDEPTQLLEGPPKTDAGDRTIPGPAWLCEDLAAMLAARVDVDRDGWLFHNTHGNPLNRDLFQANVIRPALKAAGLPATIRTHDLRHSHASLLIELGANPLAIAQRMGHSDPNVTLRVFGHLFEGAQAKLSEQLDALRAATAGAPEEAAVIELDERHSGRNRTRETQPGRTLTPKIAQVRISLSAGQKQFRRCDLGRGSASLERSSPSAPTQF
jgi:hypothetical protein